MSLPTGRGLPLPWRDLRHTEMPVAFPPSPTWLARPGAPQLPFDSSHGRQPPPAHWLHQTHSRPPASAQRGEVGYAEVLSALAGVWEGSWESCASHPGQTQSVLRTENRRAGGGGSQEGALVFGESDKGPRPLLAPLTLQGSGFRAEPPDILLPRSLFAWEPSMRTAAGRSNRSFSKAT